MYKKPEPIRNNWDGIPGGLRKHPTGLCQEIGIGDERASCVDCPQPCQEGLICSAGGFINREIFLGTRSKFMATDLHNNSWSGQGSHAITRAVYHYS